MLFCVFVCGYIRVFILYRIFMFQPDSPNSMCCS